MPADASYYHSPSPPLIRARSRWGGPVRQRWQRDGRITCGRLKKGGTLGCHRSRNPRDGDRLARQTFVHWSGQDLSTSRQGGLNEGLNVLCECWWLAAWHHSDDVGDVWQHSPQPMGPRPLAPFSRHTRAAVTLASVGVLPKAAWTIA